MPAPKQRPRRNRRGEDVKINTRKKLQLRLPEGLLVGPEILPAACGGKRCELLIPSGNQPTATPPAGFTSVRRWKDLPAFAIERSADSLPAAAAATPAVTPKLPSYNHSIHHVPLSPQQQQPQPPQPQVQPLTEEALEAMSNRQKRLVTREEDLPFYCEPCQKGFMTKEKYDAHMTLHIYCEYPGCSFTCKEDKAYRMEEHVKMLHLRPDAPNLQDSAAYVTQRRSRFPTKTNVDESVERLFYQQAKGEHLPSERRRWLHRQLKLPQYSHFLENLKQQSQQSRERRKRSRSASSSLMSSEESSSRDDDDDDQDTEEKPRGEGNVKEAVGSKRDRKEDDLPANRQHDRLPDNEEPAKLGREEDDLPPVPVAARDPTQPAPFTSVVAPVAAQKLARESKAQRDATESSGTAEATHQPPASSKSAGLYERLTEDERVADRGLLLQALRLFVMSDFLKEDVRGSGGQQQPPPSS